MAEKRLRSLSQQTQFFGDLPDRVLLDTTVYLRAFFERNGEDVALCRDFFRAMDENGKMMFMAGPTVAELIRGDPKREIPRSRYVVPVAFDWEAGHVLGRIAPARWLSEGRQRGLNGERDSIRYDALLCGCALKVKAKAVISLDRRIARGLPPGTLEVVHPIDFVLPALREQYGYPVGVAPGVAPVRIPVVGDPGADDAAP